MCGGDFATCKFNADLEAFLAISPAPYLTLGDGSNTFLLANRNCPLYAGASDSSECVQGGSSSVRGTVGGVIGGMVVGAAVMVVVLIVVVVVLWRKARGAGGGEEMSPHPKTLKFPDGEDKELGGGGGGGGE